MSKGSGRLSLAFRDIEEIHPRIVDKFAHRVTDLDLSNNRISNIDALKDFGKLETLVLDKNQISSHTKFPNIPTLKTLWVNHNNITNLSVFIDKLVDAVPNLRYLSMLGNSACPNFLNNGTLSQYNDYRKYIINRLRSLTQLDSDPVTEKERVEAIKIYGQLQTSVALDQEEREKEAREREEKEKSRYQREKELAEKRKEEVKKKRLRKLQLQKEKRDALKESNEEKKEETEEEKTPEEKLASILPEVDERTNIADRNVPLLVANIDGEPPLPPDFEDVNELTSDEEWSDDQDEDPSLYSTDNLVLPSVLPRYDDSDSDDGWD